MGVRGWFGVYHSCVASAQLIAWDVVGVWTLKALLNKEGPEGTGEGCKVFNAGDGSEVRVLSKMKKYGIRPRHYGWSGVLGRKERVSHTLI